MNRYASQYIKAEEKISELENMSGECIWIDTQKERIRNTEQIIKEIWGTLQKFNIHTFDYQKKRQKRMGRKKFEEDFPKLMNYIKPEFTKYTYNKNTIHKNKCNVGIQ